MGVAWAFLCRHLVSGCLRFFYDFSRLIYPAETGCFGKLGRVLGIARDLGIGVSSMGLLSGLRKDQRTDDVYSTINGGLLMDSLPAFVSIRFVSWRSEVCCARNDARRTLSNCTHSPRRMQMNQVPWTATTEI